MLAPLKMLNLPRIDRTAAEGGELPIGFAHSEIAHAIIAVADGGMCLLDNRLAHSIRRLSGGHADFLT
ncbi:MAG TPA: hypothetical protein QF469_07985 [Sphingomonas sanguinis]|uniref:hypothetical protein n=1 Tax=Sphingomonas sanguinis TaxID=33051 RepID=UPI002AC0E4CD|nr:hypothetical protein [Sphingomonas sanguinis]